MGPDRLVALAVEERLSELVSEIVRREPRLGRTRLVCVDGPSAAGKSVFAERLAAGFTPPAPVVHTDDLLAGWDDQFTFWPRLERQVLAPLRVGQPGRYRTYDWGKRSFSGPEIEVPPVSVVIVEGVGAARAVARTEASLTIFVTAPISLRLVRSALRDGDELRPHLERWRQLEAVHFAEDATAAHVDLIIDTDDTRDTGEAGDADSGADADADRTDGPPASC